MQDNNQKEIRLDDESALLTFLQFTKEGKYAVIDTSSLPYARISEAREDLEEEYVYGIS